MATPLEPGVQPVDERQPQLSPAIAVVVDAFAAKYKPEIGDTDLDIYKIIEERDRGDGKKDPWVSGDSLYNVSSYKKRIQQLDSRITAAVIAVHGDPKKPRNKFEQALATHIGDMYAKISGRKPTATVEATTPDWVIVNMLIGDAFAAKEIEMKEIEEKYGKDGEQLRNAWSLFMEGYDSEGRGQVERKIRELITEDGRQLTPDQILRKLITPQAPILFSSDTTFINAGKYVRSVQGRQGPFVVEVAQQSDTADVRETIWGRPTQNPFRGSLREAVDAIVAEQLLLEEYKEAVGAGLQSSGEAVRRLLEISQDAIEAVAPTPKAPKVEVIDKNALTTQEIAKFAAATATANRFVTMIQNSSLANKLRVEFNSSEVVSIDEAVQRAGECYIRNVEVPDTNRVWGIHIKTKEISSGDLVETTIVINRMVLEERERMPEASDTISVTFRHNKGDFQSTLTDNDKRAACISWSNGVTENGHKFPEIINMADGLVAEFEEDFPQTARRTSAE